MSSVVVVGSLNVDVVLRVARLPAAGETIVSESAHRFPGGKGANQALACARAGARVSMVGRAGDDADGDLVVGSLVSSGVDVARVHRDVGHRTGVAQITVDDAGRNTIVVAALANAQLTLADVDAAGDTIRAARALLLSLEVPLEVVHHAADLAKRAAVKVIMNAAPAPPDGLPPDLLAQLDVLIVNETEARLLSGRDVENDGGLAAATELRGRGVGAVVITLGERGAFLSDDRGTSTIPAFRAEVVDTTAAGDAFAGAFAALSAEGRTDLEAAAFGCAAGALACTVLGAEPSLPMRESIDRLLATRTI